MLSLKIKALKIDFVFKEYVTKSEKIMHQFICMLSALLGDSRVSLALTTAYPITVHRNTIQQTLASKTWDLIGHCN